MVIFPGSALASATKSRTVSAFTAGLTKKTIEAVPISPIGVKSRNGIVMHALLDRRNDGVRHVGEQEGVAVRRGFGGNLDAEAAAGAGAVVDDDLLAERFRHSLADEASEHVGAAARRIGHDEGDGTIGIGFGRERSAGERHKGGESKRCRRSHSFRAQHRYPVHHCFHALDAASIALGGLPLSPFQMLAPRALIGHSVSTRPLRTPTYQSCRLTVGSQCPGMSQSFSPSDRGRARAPTLSLPCSSETPVTSTSGRSCTHGGPRSAL